MRLTATLFLSLCLVISIHAASVAVNPLEINNDVAQVQVNPSEGFVGNVDEKSNEIAVKTIDNSIKTSSEIKNEAAADLIKEAEKAESVTPCATKVTEITGSIIADKNEDVPSIPSLLEKGLIELEKLRQVASETIQNTINPSEVSQPQPATGLNEEETTPSSEGSFLQEAIENLQESFQDGIQVINQTFYDIFNGRPESTQSDEPVTQTPPNFFQQGIQAIQENFENSINRLNESFYNFIQDSPEGASTPSPTPEAQKRILQLNSQLQELQAEFQNGLKIAEEKIQGLKSRHGSVKANSDGNKDDAEPSTAPPSINPLNLFVGFINSWQQSLQNSFANLNGTVQNFFQPQSDESTDSTSRPNIFQQGIQSLQTQIQNLGQNIQTLLTGGGGQNDQKVSTTPRPANPIVQGFHNISQNIQQGIQNIGQSIQNVIRPQESSTSSDTNKPGSNEVPTQTEVVSQPPKEDQSDSPSIKPDEKKVGEIDSKGGGGGGNKDPAVWSAVVGNILGQVSSLITTTVTLADNSVNRIINTIGTNAQTLITAVTG